jgi:hypothetical protein
VDLRVDHDSGSSVDVLIVCGVVYKVNGFNRSLYLACARAKASYARRYEIRARTISEAANTRPLNKHH